jgi:peptidoglycan/LPS O-acetylase OafA/YrhL
VDALRGLAALAVMFYHIPRVPLAPPHRSGLLFFPLDYSFRGVTLFLVISGFCIHLSTARRLARGEGASCSWIAFWRRRFYRLYPPYLAAILFSLLTGLCIFQNSVFQSYVNGSIAPAWDVITHLLMVHNLVPSCTGGLGNAAFWSLGLEEQLYLLYAPLLLWRAYLPATRVFLLTVAVTLAWNVAGSLAGGHFVPGGNWTTWPLSFWLIWALGAVAAEAHAGAVTLPRWCYWSSLGWLAAAVSALLHPPLLNLLHADRLLAPILGGGWALRLVHDYYFVVRMGDCAFAFACFVLLNRWIRAEVAGRFHGPIRRSLTTVGTMSYSLYLTHVPVLVLCEVLYGKYQVLHGKPIAPPTILTTLLRYAVYLPLVLSAAGAFYYFVERRFLNPWAAPAQPAAVALKRAA